MISSIYHVTTISDLYNWNLIRSLIPNFLSNYNLQFDLSDAPVTFKLEQGHQKLVWTCKLKLTGGYHCAKFKRSQFLKSQRKNQHQSLCHRRLMTEWTLILTIHLHTHTIFHMSKNKCPQIRLKFETLRLFSYLKLPWVYAYISDIYSFDAQANRKGKRMKWGGKPTTMLIGSLHDWYCRRTKNDVWVAKLATENINTQPFNSASDRCPQAIILPYLDTPLTKLLWHVKIKEQMIETGKHILDQFVRGKKSQWLCTLRLYLKIWIS